MPDNFKTGGNEPPCLFSLYEIYSAYHELSTHLACLSHTLNMFGPENRLFPKHPKAQLKKVVAHKKKVCIALLNFLFLLNFKMPLHLYKCACPSVGW